VYLHPYELAVHELRLLRQQGWRVRPNVRLRQSLFRGRVEARLGRLFAAFPFGPMMEALGLTPRGSGRHRAPEADGKPSLGQRGASDKPARLAEANTFA
jgi:hypothetical protein